MSPIILRFLAYVRGFSVPERVRGLRVQERVARLQPEKRLIDSIRFLVALPRWVPWTALVVLVLIAIWALTPRGPLRVEIPYTTFVQQVRAGNVNWVAFEGNTIRGVFRTPARGDSLQTAGPVRGDARYPEFITRFPPGMTDPRLLPILDDAGVIVFASEPQVDWARRWRLISLIPLLLSLAVVPYISLRASRARARATMVDVEAEQERRLDLVRSYATFGDVAGQEAAKSELADVVEYLRRPEAYLQLRADVPRAVLLIGPSGSGKSLIAQSVAGEAGVPIYRLSPSSLLSSNDHLVTNPIRDAFDRARENAPAIVFLDDVDVIISSRAGEADVNLTQLLVELDSLTPDLQVMILAAATRLDCVSPLLLRRGRFRRQVQLALPERADRLSILRSQTVGVPLAEDVDLEEIARKTPGLSGTDLVRLCRQSALAAALRQESRVTRADFDNALAHLASIGEVSSTLLTREQRRVAAFHEAGHALMSLLLPGAPPFHRLSILPRTDTFGAPALAQTSVLTKNQLLSSLTVMIAGRAAEEMLLGDITTGAGEDLARATRLARRMVSDWGMSDLGPVSFEGGDENDRALSEATAAQIDRSVRVLMEDRHAVARHILKNNRPLLDRLAEHLVRDESLDREEVLRLVGTPTPASPERPGARTQP